MQCQASRALTACCPLPPRPRSTPCSLSRSVTSGFVTIAYLASNLQGVSGSASAWTPARATLRFDQSNSKLSHTVRPVQCNARGTKLHRVQRLDEIQHCKDMVQLTLSCGTGPQELWAFWPLDARVDVNWRECTKKQLVNNDPTLACRQPLDNGSSSGLPRL